METPTSGKIYLRGACVSTPEKVAPPETRGLGFLFQDHALFPHLDVRANIGFGITQLPDAERRARIDALLEQVDMRGFGAAFPHTLSGGEQQRVALARALAPNPDLMLMDEPFSGLDAPLRDQMRDLTLELLEGTGAAALIVTHDAADALQMADRIAVQREGRLIQVATPAEIYAHPADVDVARLFGTVNLRDGVGVRPESIRLGAGEASDDFTFTAQLVSCRPAGADWRCHLVLDGDLHWQALLRRPEAPALGAHDFYVPRAALMLFEDEKERGALCP